jgi:hypothetical protein
LEIVARARIENAMKRAQPRGLSRRRVEQLLSQLKSNSSAGDRIEGFSRHFLGLPYKTNPLIGTVDTPEVFTASLDEFDCVTYVETVVALARASAVDEFFEWLRRIRYEQGMVEWERRNHYMSSWIRNNIKSGALRRLPAKIVPVSKRRTLNAVPGLGPMKVQFECVPKASIGKLKRDVKTGDLMFFGSTRKHLDIFHCGILVWNGDRLFVRHASRSQHGVVEQDLDDFLKKNRMSGVIVVRPTEAAREDSR